LLCSIIFIFTSDRFKYYTRSFIIVYGYVTFELVRDICDRDYEVMDTDGVRKNQRG